MRENLLIYDGSIHTLYSAIEEEHPYFGNDDWFKGSITLKETKYHDIWLRYNILTDNIIIENFYEVYSIQLNPDFIKSFTLGNHVFVKLNITHFQDGFYELLYNGAIKLYAKRTKIHQEEISNLKILEFFPQSSKHYIFLNGEYSLIKGKKSIIQLFNDRKKEIKKFIRQNDLSFMKNKEEAILKITKYYCEN